MNSPIITVSPGDSVQQLARVLTEGGISGAPVLDDKGELVGIVSEADVVGKRGNSVEDVMRQSVITVDGDTSVEEVCSLMARNNINRVPVLEGHQIVGIITRTDIVRGIAGGSIPPGMPAAQATAVSQNAGG